MASYLLRNADSVFIASQLLYLAFLLPSVWSDRQKPLPVLPPRAKLRLFRLHRIDPAPWTAMRVFGLAASLLSFLAALNFAFAAFFVGLPSYKERYGHDSAYRLYTHQHPGQLLLMLTFGLAALYLIAWLGLQRRKHLHGPLPNPRRLRPFGFVVVLCTMLYVVQATELIFISFNKM